MRAGARGCLLVSVCALLSSGAAAEQPYETPVRIEYAAPGGCPDEAELTSRIRQRLARARFAEPGEMARTFRLRVTSRPDRSLAQVEFVDADGTHVSRAIGAKTCDEVVNAIALVTALAMDARASDETPPEPVAAPPPPEPAPAPVAPSPAPLPAPPTRAREPESRLRWDAGAGVGLATGYAPEPAAGLHLFGEVAADQGALRLSAAHADSGTITAGADRTRFRFWGGRLEGCPLRFALAEPIALSPCAGLDAGALRGEGLPGPGVVVTREATELWLAAVAVARAQLGVEDFLLIEAQIDVRFPLLRHEFVLETPDRRVHEVPALALGAALAVGFRLR
jgi:hypothetical protein